jgi:transposase
MRKSDPPVRYLVGTPKGRLVHFEARLAESPWATAREGVEVKTIEEDGELYVLAKSKARSCKERGMRQRRLKKYWKRLHELQKQKLTYESFHQKYGAAKKEAGAAAKLVEVQLPERPAAPSKSQKSGAEKSGATEVIAFGFNLSKPELRKVRSREGRYLLRSNLAERDPAKLWQHYMTLGRIEEAFRNLKGDLALRPVYHSKENRIEAHIFVAFLSYCLHVTLQQRLKGLAPGLSPRSVLEKFASLQMLDVHLPTTDGRRLILSRYTQPDTDCRMLLAQLKLSLPEQAPPKIAAQTTPAAPK